MSTLIGAELKEWKEIESQRQLDELAYKSMPYIPGNIGFPPGTAQTVTTRTSVLQEADQIVNGARNKAYGSAEDNFQNIANLWNAYTGLSLKAVDVANMMALMKIARLKHSPDHRDSWVDIAGYAACGAECGLKKPS